MYQEHLPEDLLSLGARAADLDRLLAILLDSPPSADDLAEVRRALHLSGPARSAALHSIDGGPRVMAAVEVGRRALTGPLDDGNVFVGAAMMVKTALALTDNATDDTVALFFRQEPEGSLVLVGRTACARPRVRTLLSGALRRAATHLCLLRRGNLRVPPEQFLTLALATCAGALAVDLNFIDALVVDRREGFCSLRDTGRIP